MAGRKASAPRPARRCCNRHRHGRAVRRRPVVGTRRVPLPSVRRRAHSRGPIPALLPAHPVRAPL